MKKQFLAGVLTLGISAALLLTSSVPAFSQGDSGYLRTRCKPAVAGVFVDGNYKGTVSQFQSSKKVIPLPPGQHEVSIVDPRYETFRKTVNIEAGRTEVVRESLRPKTLAKPPFGNLKIKNGNRAAVYVNNQYFGQADEFNGPGQGLLLNPGEYNLRVVPIGGGSPLEQKITITAKQTTTITMQ